MYKIFEDEIAHLKDINKRLAISEGLSFEAFNQLPETSKVRILEADPLLERIKGKIQSKFSEAINARYNVIFAIHREEIREKKYSEVRRILNMHERIIALLEEIDKSAEDITTKSSMPIVYFSYAWGDNTEVDESRVKIVDDLYHSLKENNFDVRRDKMNIEYGGLISKFMEEIGESDLAIVAISEKYLKSSYCMWELCEIHQNCSLNKIKFSRHILPIRIESIDLVSPTFLTEYLKYWQYKYEEYFTLLTDFPQEIGEPQLLEFKKIRTIKDRFAEIVGFFQDLNAKSIDILRENNFEQVKTAIINRDITNRI